MNISDYQNNLKNAIEYTINENNYIDISSIKIKPESRIQGILGSKIQLSFGLDYNIEYESRVKEIRKSMFYYNLKNEFQTYRVKYLSDFYKDKFDRKGGNVDLVITDINNNFSACSLLSGVPYALIELKTDINDKIKLEKDLMRIYDFISQTPDRNQIKYTTLIIISESDFDVSRIFKSFSYKNFTFMSTNHTSNIKLTALSDKIELKERIDYISEENNIDDFEVIGKIFYYSIITLYRDNGDKVATENQNNHE